MSIEFLSLNPFGSLIEAYREGKGALVFVADAANLALIPEPVGGPDKNEYFRSEPRALIEYAQTSLLARKPELATPGAVWSILSDPDLLVAAASVDAEEGDDHLAALARHVLDMRQNEEHWPQHRGAAVRALRIFGAGSPLHQVGAEQ